MTGRRTRERDRIGGKTLTGEQFWLMEKMSHLDKVSLLDNAGFLPYAPSGCKIPSSLSMEDTSSHGHIEKPKAALFWKFGISTSILAMQVLLFASGVFSRALFTCSAQTSRMFAGHECGYIDRHLSRNTPPCSHQIHRQVPMPKQMSLSTAVRLKLQLSPHLNSTRFDSKSSCSPQPHTLVLSFTRTALKSCYSPQLRSSVLNLNEIDSKITSFPNLCQPVLNYCQTRSPRARSLRHHL
jgi:hypothetical protein